MNYGRKWKQLLDDLIACKFFSNVGETLVRAGWTVSDMGQYEEKREKRKACNQKPNHLFADC